MAQFLVQTSAELFGVRLLPRLYHQRRLIVLCAALPMLGAAIVWPFALVFATGIISAFAFTALLAKWPAGNVDVVSMALTGLIAIPFWSLTADLLWSYLEEPNQMATAWFLFLTVFGTFFLWLGLFYCVALLEDIPAGTVTQEFTGWTDLSPDETARAIIMRPGDRKSGYRCGPADENGFFPVAFTVETVAEDDFKDIRQDVSYLQRLDTEEVNADGARRYVTQSVLTTAGAICSSMKETLLTPEEGGTSVITREVHDTHSQLSRMMFWLENTERAYFDHSISCFKSQKIDQPFFSHQTTLMMRLARFFVATNLAPKNDL